MNAVARVYADESNNSGENLLDPAQRIYCVSAVHIDHGLAEQVVADTRSKLPSSQKEPKYTSLANSGKGRQALLTAFEALSGQAIRVYVADKRFMVAAKIVDVLIEELMFENGYNMYADGSVKALANALHMVGPIFGDAAAYERMLQAFVDTMRRRQKSDVDALYSAIGDYLATVDPEWDEIISLLRFTRAHADRWAALISRREVNEVLDPAVPCLVELCRDMGSLVGGDFELVHDESRVVDENSWLLMNLNQMHDPTRPGHMLQGLPLVGISFAVSSDVPELQLADWVAGAARQWATTLTPGLPDPFATHLESVVEPWIVGALWPTTDAIPGYQP